MIENNRIFCTFSTKESLEENIAKITSTYTIPGGRLFVLRAIEEEMFLLTYNLEFENLAKFPENTILVHRKKDFNVLYTINALNFLVKQITGGFANNKVEVDWRPYRSSLLLTEEGIFKQIRTKLFNIKNLES